MTDRREFLGQLSMLGAVLAVDADELEASSIRQESAWDTSWIDKLATAQYRVVFNGSEIADGTVLSHAAGFLADFHEVHGTRDTQTRPVIVFRRGGTPIAFNDTIWNRYALGEQLKIDDPATNARAKRNVFWKPRPGASPESVDSKLESLHQRGLISLVCNIAVRNWAAGLAEKARRDPEEVRAEVRANLVPGAILVPSGVYGLIRAQNAGCAYMPGA
jgi:intracellular sulfur oxidation DsrE/DsrF family protein